MNRIIAAILVVSIIPACDWNDRWDNDHEVSISNLGNESVRVEVRYGDDDWWYDEFRSSFTVAGGDVRVDSYLWYHRVDVRITRADGTLLFADVFHPDDFEDHNDRISITVIP